MPEADANGVPVVKEADKTIKCGLEASYRLWALERVSLFLCLKSFQAVRRHRTECT